MTRCVLFWAAVLILVATSSAASQQTHNWGSVVDQLLSASAAKNFEQIGNLYAPNANFSANGERHQGRNDILKHYSDLLFPIMIYRATVTSNFFALDNTVHFGTQEFFAKAHDTLGECIAVVHALHRIVLNEQDKIIFHRIEWEETLGQFADDLQCMHNAKHHAHTRVQDLIVARSFERHRNVESLSLRRFLRGFADLVAIVTSVKEEDGAARSVGLGHVAIRALFEHLFNQTSSASFAPVTPIYLRDHATFSISAFYGITHTGCTINFQMVNYNQFDRQGKIAVMEQLMIGIDAAQLNATLYKDCGRPKPTRPEHVTEDDPEDDEVYDEEEEYEGDAEHFDEEHDEDDYEELSEEEIKELEREPQAEGAELSEESASATTASSTAATSPAGQAPTA